MSKSHFISILECFSLRAKSSHMAASICAAVEAVGGQRGGGAGPGADGRGQLGVADLRDHVVGLPAFQFLPHQPLHLLPVGLGVPSLTFILNHRSTKAELHGQTQSH